MLRGDLTDDDRDYLEERLHATMKEILAGGREIQDIEDPVHVTRMLAVIDRPVDPDRYGLRMQTGCFGSIARQEADFSRPAVSRNIFGRGASKKKNWNPIRLEAA